MDDDIVTRLRSAEDNGICEWQVLIDAADEIERLRAELDYHVGSVVERDSEIERLRARCAAADAICLDAGDEIRRLRAAGDQLIAVMRSGTDSGWDNAIDTWEEARRG